MEPDARPAGPGRLAADRGHGLLGRPRSGLVTRARPRVHAALVPPVALGILVAAFVVTFTVLVIRRHEQFGSFAYDMGIFDQNVWLFAHGEQFITVRGLPALGHHGSFGLALFAPAYWLGAGPNFLNAVQVTTLALGAVPLYLLARHRGLGQWPACALGAVWLLCPAVQFMNQELFHPEAMALTPLLCAYLCSVRRSWGWFTFWIVLAMSWKEDVAIAVLMIGLLVAWRGDRRVGLLTAAVAAIWFALVSYVMLPEVSGLPNHYEALYDGVGGSPGGILETAFRDPGRLTSRIFSGESGNFALELIAPFGFVALLAIGTLLIGLPQFLLDVLSDVGWTREITFHYAALPTVALALATVEAVSRLGRRFGTRVVAALAAVVVLGGLVTTVVYGPSPLGDEDRYWPSRPAAEVRARQAAVDAVPDGAAVSASYLLVPHLTHRERIYMFPNPWQASYWGYRDRKQHDPGVVEWIVVDRLTLGASDTAVLESILDTGEFRVVFERGPLLAARRVEAPNSRGGT